MEDKQTIYFILNIVKKNIYKIIFIVVLFNILLLGYLVTNKASKSNDNSVWERKTTSGYRGTAPIFFKFHRFYRLCA